ncbi:cytochrome c55X [Sphaerotilus hippei]|uniref:Cytochrome c55X n=1 Tax=Sphaerotilus hippei TaxID=744406 RepID=A0A318GW15_9BURK|nr:cytochrome c [Sphaerotilus hippei]PXW93396.1 cytochrome c55X [Sphaerotilus hippei]
MSPHRHGVVLLALLAGAGGVGAAALDHPEAVEPDGPRRQQLVRMVTQDCGSCHGMRLTGGLGPALTPAALSGLPADSVAATIFHGRPGTPMPPWRAMLSEAEARWIAERLRAGFPDDLSKVSR